MGPVLLDVQPIHPALADFRPQAMVAVITLKQCAAQLPFNMTTQGHALPGRLACAAIQCYGEDNGDARKIWGDARKIWGSAALWRQRFWRRCPPWRKTPPYHVPVSMSAAMSAMASAASPPPLPIRPDLVTSGGASEYGMLFGGVQAGYQHVFPSHFHAGPRGRRPFPVRWISRRCSPIAPTATANANEQLQYLGTLRAPFRIHPGQMDTFRDRWPGLGQHPDLPPRRHERQ